MTRLPVDFSRGSATVYICNLFINDVRNSGYTASNFRMMVNELGRIRYEVMDQFKVLLSRNLSSDCEHHEKHQPVSLAKIEPNTSRIQIACDNLMDHSSNIKNPADSGGKPNSSSHQLLLVCCLDYYSTMKTEVI